MLPSLPSAVRSSCLLTTQMHACHATPCGARHDTQTARIPTVTQDTFELALALALPIIARSISSHLTRLQRRTACCCASAITRLTLLAYNLRYAFFGDFIAAPARARFTHLALPRFVGVPPAVHEVPPTAAPRLSVLDGSPGLAAALAPGRPLRCTTASDPQHCSAR